MPTSKLVIFDHDGLMVNTEDVVFSVLQRLFARHGYDFTWEYYTTTIGLPVIDSLALYLDRFPIGLTLDAFATERDLLVGEAMASQLRLMPGLLPLLDDLRARAVPLAVATSGTRAHITASLRRFGLIDYFSAVICIDDVQRGKPHPDLILKTLDATGTAPENALMLDDAPLGVEAAHRAGVFCIAVPTRGIDANRFPTASLIARDLAAVRHLLTLLER